MNSREEAEDMVSQGFTKVFQGMPQFEYRDINSLRAWIKKIMVNECLMRLRKTHNFSLVSVGEHEDLLYNDPNMFKMEAADIINTLNELPAGYRTVLNLYAIEGYNHSEIAEMLCISEGTSRSQLNKARKLMKEKLNQINKEHAERQI